MIPKSNRCYRNAFPWELRIPILEIWLSYSLDICVHFGWWVAQQTWKDALADYEIRSATKLERSRDMWVILILTEAALQVR